MICNSLASTWAQIWARPNSTPVIASRKENASWTSLSENLTYESVWPAGLHAHLAVILSEQFGTNSPQNGFGGLNILSILEVALQWLLEKHVPVFSGGRAFRKIRCWGFGRSLANFERNWARSQSRKPWVISGDVKSTRRILFFIARSNIKSCRLISTSACSEGSGESCLAFHIFEEVYQIYMAATLYLFIFIYWSSRWWKEGNQHVRFYFIESHLANMFNCSCHE